MNKWQKCLLKQKLIGLGMIIGSIIFVIIFSDVLGSESMFVPIILVPWGLHCLFTKRIVFEFDELYEEDEEDWV